MSRYIDAEPLEHRSPKLRALILEQPTVDVVKARHGHWLLDSSGAEFCSECGEYPFDDGEYHISGWSSKYCPNCGAKMDEKEQEHEKASKEKA